MRSCVSFAKNVNEVGIAKMCKTFTVMLSVLTSFEEQPTTYRLGLSPKMIPEKKPIYELCTITGTAEENPNWVYHSNFRVAGKRGHQHSWIYLLQFHPPGEHVDDDGLVCFLHCAVNLYDISANGGVLINISFHVLDHARDQSLGVEEEKALLAKSAKCHTIRFMLEE
jgi:hypothetical protein